MSRHWMIVGAVSLALTAMCAAGVRAEDKDGEKGKEQSEVKMSIKDVPPEVRATLKREANGEKIKTVDKEKKDGKTVYEADVVIDGTNYEIIVGKNGKLISKMIDEEEEQKASSKDDKEQKGSKADSEDNDDEKKMKKGKKASSKEDDEQKSSKADSDDDDKKTKKASKADDEDEKPAKKSVKGKKVKEENDDK